MNTKAITASGSTKRPTARTKSRLSPAFLFLPLLAGTAFATPVLITAPKTINHLDTTVTPTAGGTPVALSSAEITVQGTTLTINGRHTIASFALVNNSVLTHDNATTFDYPAIGIIRGLSLTILGNASIDATSTINVSFKGYPNASGPGAGNPVPGCGGVGGGYGGVGGLGHCEAAAPGGIAYGSATEPTEFGSGGGHYIGYGLGGKGGGCVRLIITGTLNLAGSILADG